MVNCSPIKCILRNSAARFSVSASERLVLAASNEATFGSLGSPSPILVVPQLRNTIMLLDALKGLGFDLADALARHAEFLADFFQRVGHTVLQAKTHLENLLLARIQILHDGLDIFAQNLQARGFGRSHCIR